MYSWFIKKNYRNSQRLAGRVYNPALLFSLKCFSWKFYLNYNFFYFHFLIINFITFCIYDKTFSTGFRLSWLPHFFILFKFIRMRIIFYIQSWHISIMQLTKSKTLNFLHFCTLILFFCCIYMLLFTRLYYLLSQTQLIKVCPIPMFIYKISSFCATPRMFKTFVAFSSEI